jgi:hypothetical protein
VLLCAGVECNAMGSAMGAEAVYRGLYSG